VRAAAYASAPTCILVSLSFFASVWMERSIGDSASSNCALNRSAGRVMGRERLADLEESILAAVAALGEDAYGLAIYNKLFEVRWATAIVHVFITR
jgi:hypothetical protein